MNRIALTLLGIAALGIVACDDGTDALTNGQRNAPSTPGTTAGGDDSTFNHNNDPGGSSDAVTAVKVVGNPEVTSRLHGCGKISFASLGELLTSRGLTGTGTRPANTQSSQQIYNAAGPALGVANYPGRVPEAPFASTSAMAKMFDIFSMASYDAVAANFNAPACPGTKIVENNQFTKDGLSCLMGKPATAEHLAIANDAIAKNTTDGAKIAISALLAAVHTCQ